MAKPKSTPEYQKAYSRLNSAQKKAVDTIEGPVMVIAGPGTGKTQVLTLRIANILLSTDTPPDAILALTFTEAGVYAMKTRLASLIGPTAYSVKIHTFHSFCNALIQEHPSYFKRLVGAEPILPIDAIITARGVIDTREWEHLTSFGDRYVHVKDIIRTISQLKREYISPKMLRERAELETHTIKSSADVYHVSGRYKGEMKGEYKKQLDRLSRTLELADAYERYEAALQAQKTYDFDDMIIEVLRVFEENTDFLQMVQEEYLYILADEHQDANTSQNTLLTLLSSFHDSPNLFLVGDEKQAIYSFQGASLEHFHTFKRQYPLAEMITLTDSYRSGTQILEASYKLMSPAVASERNPQLISRHPEPHLATVSTHAFSTEEHELAWVADDIHEKLSQGVEPTEIAVLFRNNKDADALTRALTAKDVPHIVETHQNALEHHRVQQLITWMRASADNYSDRAMAESLFAPWSGLEEADIHRIVRAVRLAREPFFDVLRHYEKIEGLRNREAVAAFVSRMKRGSEIAREDHARDFFSFCVHDSGFLRFVLTHQGTADILARVRGMLATLERHARKEVGYSAQRFIIDIGLYDMYGVAIDKDMPTPSTLQSVHLMTAHASKGLEFSYVYIIHARDKKWGNARGRTAFYIPQLEKSGDDDERRIMYVALTRAKLGACISYGQRTQEGNEALPSLFIDDLKEHASVASTTEFESKYAPHTILQRKVTALPGEDVAFLKALFVEQGLSVTALNNYLECPWRYFYRNLVRIPDVTNNHLLFGNGMHEGLKEFFDTFTESGKLPPVTYLLSCVHEHLQKQGFDAVGLAEAKKKADDAIPGWLMERKGIFSDAKILSELPLECEYHINTASLKKILLRGKIDRLDVFDDGSIRVTDYKTGKPRTRNDILGNTKSGTGDYHRQLVFYKLCMDIQNKGEMREACIDFLEPKSNGTYQLESFTISSDDVATLKATIERVAEEIYTLSFWETRCSEEKCEYCSLREGIAA